MIYLSIIVPVYKAELYIEKCILSILHNRLFDSHCELIVIDDGSPDGSMDIVDKLCTHCKTATLVRQSNQGASMARNAGESLARGKYLWFVDNDDWLVPEAVANIVELAIKTNADVINIEHQTADGRDSTVMNNSEIGVIYSGQEYLNRSYVQNPVWNYIYRTDFYRNEELKFDRDIIHEDSLFTPIAIFKAARVVRLGRLCYIHNVREGSIMTSTTNLVHARDMLKVFGKLDAFRLNQTSGIFESRIISRYAVYSFGGVFHHWKLLEKKQRCMVSKEMNPRVIIGAIVRSGVLKYLFAIAIMLRYRFICGSIR